jgi:hypothetical protein
MIQKEILEFTVLKSTTKWVRDTTYASKKSSSRATPQLGTELAILMRIGFPAISAGRLILKLNQIGKFQGRMPKLGNLNNL